MEIPSKFLPKYQWLTRLLSAWFVFLGISSAEAQTPASTPQDPLLSLLLAQPRMELSRPVRVTASFDPPAVRPGQRAVYRVTFSAMDDAIDWPESLSVSPQVPMRPGARAQLLQMNGPVMEPRTGINYHFAPKQPGRVTVPAFEVKVYGKPVTVPAAYLQVDDSAPAGVEPQMLSLEISPTNAYVGEATKVRVMLPATWSGVQVLSQVQVIGQGLVVDKSSVRQSIEPVGGAAANRIAYIHETMATPITTGKIRLHAQGWCAPNRPPAQAIVGGVPVGTGLEYMLLDSDQVEVSSRPLPPFNEIPGFTGAVGTFTVDPPQFLGHLSGAPSTAKILQVGDPVRLSVTVRGVGNIARFVPPPPPANVSDWQVFPAQVDRSTPQLLHAKGAVSFTYTLVPLSDEVRHTPLIPFAFFDPRRGAYTTTNIPSVPVEVAPGEGTRALQTIAAARAIQDSVPPDPELSGLALVPGVSSATMVPLQLRPWFPLVQVAPALAFAGLWAWDRRRRYLAQHPALVVRRRARRALRRERRRLCRAVQRGERERFEHSAIRCLQIGCAPSLAAQPSALVGADVLQALRTRGAPHEELEAVRRVFRVKDAERFALRSNGSPDLIALAPHVESSLDRLEQSLCK